ncbi:unnamed protein product [Aureobasidium vineae]|uniref:Protein YOP1 n=1 Tax=Aureobasidium vineae TaxID=2773715 RepID=A0A9N8JKS2_9PEZI|nr:unnamed protein product [Aureobasidium vineae]
MSFQERAQSHISQLDKELSKYPALNNFEQQSSVPKVYVVLGLGALYFFLIFFNIAGEFLVNFAGFIIPGYYSLEALFSQTKADDTHWLTYWVTYAFLTVLESAVNAVYWFLGAKIVFNSLLHPLFGRFFNQGPIENAKTQ